MMGTRFGADMAVANLAGAQLLANMVGTLELPTAACEAGQRSCRMPSEGRKPGMSSGL